MKVRIGYFFLFFLFSWIGYAQEINEETYRKIDKEIWDEYEIRMKEVSEEMKRYPEKEDSLMAVRNSIYQTACQKNMDAAIRFASTPSGLQRLFMVRLDISKDTISSILETLDPEMRESAYGKSLQEHLLYDQLSEGDKYVDFSAYNSNGEEFRLSSLEGKKILLLYGGLGCMGEEGRNFLKQLYEETSREDLEIVVYQLSSNLDKLKETCEYYQAEYIQVSDFLEDRSPFKIIYGAQGTPTCFFIDEEGTILLKCSGLKMERMRELVK